MRIQKARCILLPMLVLWIGLAACGSAVSASEPAPAAQPQFINLRIINAKTKGPVADVGLEVQFNSKDWKTQVILKDKTDAEGRAKVRVPDWPVYSYRVYLLKEGFPPLRVYWGDGEAPPESEFTVPMDPAVPIGGTVRDEQARPIEGVTVAFYFYRPDDGRIRISFTDCDVKTDKDGRWRSDMAPADLNDELRIFLNHPDYVSDQRTPSHTPLPKYPTPSVKALQALAGDYVMKKGIAIRGTVVDGEGKPIAGARVQPGEDAYTRPAVEADDKGAFRLPNAEPGEVVVTVSKEGFVPEVTRAAVREGMAPLRFQLAKGQTLRGRVVDKQGNAVAGATAVADQWRQVRTLKWSMATDAEGRFVWNGAPAEAVKFDVYKRGYMSTRNVSLKASDEEHIITLLPSLRMTGKVVDAETRKPVEAFRAIHGIDFGQGADRAHWGRQEEKKCTGGAYEIVQTEPYLRHYVRIEADGYTPAVSRLIASDEGDVAVDFKLQKGQGISGVVRAGDGKPAAGATVVLATPSQGAYIRNGAQVGRGECPTTTTDAEGRFALPPQTGAWALVVLHAAGYAAPAREAWEKSKDIQLVPWGRIEGKLMIGPKPGAGQTVVVNVQDSSAEGQPRLHHDIQATADRDGGFTFDRVPPGGVSVAHQVRVNESMRTCQAYVREKVESGKTLRVTIGGTGRAVVGQVILPPGVKSVDFARSGHAVIRARDEMPDPPLPPNWESMDPQGRREWREKWLATPEGQAYAKAEDEYHRNMKIYNLIVRPEGAFWMEDVPAGKYQLSIIAGKSAADPNAGLLGAVSRDFIIPEMPGGRSDEPLDLGKLPLETEVGVPVRPGVAAAAPERETKKLVGQALPALESFGLKPARELASGKKTLVCFWDVAQRPSRQCVTALGSMVDELAAKGVAVVLVHAAAGGPQKLGEWLATAKVTVPCGQVPAGQEQKALSAWGAVRLPWLVLADEKHVVRAEGFGLADLDERIKETSR